jgi:5'-3' exonuclease
MGRKRTEEDYFVFIDLSNFIFHRFHALNSWKKFSNNTFESEEECINKFAQMFEQHLVKMKTRCKCKWTNMFLAKDCYRADIWRVQHYPEYKACRSNRNEIISEIFKKTYNVIIPELKEKYNFNLISNDNAEGDDIISISKKYLRKKFPTRIIIIITNDNDYIQLIDEYTLIKNQTFQPIIDTRIPQELKSIDDTVTAKNYLNFKILKGDKSDNIQPIFSRITNKLAFEYINNPDKLMDRVKNDNALLEKYKINNLLINLDMIPKDIQNSVIEKLELLLKN